MLKLKNHGFSSILNRLILKSLKKIFFNCFFQPNFIKELKKLNFKDLITLYINQILKLCVKRNKIKQNTHKIQRKIYLD